MNISRSRESARRRRVALAISGGIAVAIGIGGSVRGAEEPAVKPAATFKQYCFQCHGGSQAMGGVSLEKLTAQTSIGEGFQTWQKVIGVLETNRMPPKGMPQPSEIERNHAVAWIRGEMDTFGKKFGGDPGHVTVRRLTSGEYAYAIRDLTGIDIDAGIDASSDSVGGEGFTNFGDVQFMQDSNLERYLDAAKLVANHAVIGAGPIEFYTDPGKTGFELSAIARIKTMYGKYGFRTVSGEGGIPFGLDKYRRAFMVAWRYRNRVALGEPKATIASLAAEEGIGLRFAQHISDTLNRKDLVYPLSEVQARFQKLPTPSGADSKTAIAAARSGCQEMEKYVTTWPSWLFSRGDVAAGGAGDESPLILNEQALRVEPTHRFSYNTAGRGGGGRGRGPVNGPTRVFVNVASVNPNVTSPVIIWRNARIVAGRGPGRGQAPAGGQTPAQPAAAGAGQQQAGGAGQFAGRRANNFNLPTVPLRTVITPESAAKLNFGKSIDGTTLGPDDFATTGSFSFEIPQQSQPAGGPPPAAAGGGAGGGGFGFGGVVFQVDAELGKDHDQVFRIVFSDREESNGRGIPTRAILGDPKSAGFEVFKKGFFELVDNMPPNSHSEPTPADKDPIPLPFDSTYNVPEHDAFDNDVKYVRDDKFVVQYMLDDAQRTRLDNAWNDLYAAADWHNDYLKALAVHYKIDLKGKTAATLTPAELAAMPTEAQGYMKPILAGYKTTLAAEAAGRSRHFNDCLEFASKAWRRPLTEKEKIGLRAFFDKVKIEYGDHDKAVRAVITRILVAPQFLYRVESAASTVAPSSPRLLAAASLNPPAMKPLSNWEMASRLSFFLWSSIPDEELRRAAAAGELTNSEQLQRQVKRMLTDPKARRLSSEFFGQWLGFYHFDEFKGVDTSRFPEFTTDVKEGMYDEAVSFFEYIVRQERPIREMLSADYTFLNQPLAKFYGVKKEVKSKDDVEKVDGANSFERGGMLRLGAVLTATSAPQRTSPVKRGDWVLRRILGTPTPPPPPDAGSIPADPKLFGGLTVKERMAQHKRNATCANCHMRIDPLGFSLEHYDSTGRWRGAYADGKAVDDTSTLMDQSEISGVNGLLAYLQKNDAQVRKNFSYKLLGYALGRTVQASDQPLVDKLIADGSDATVIQLATEIVTSKQFRNHLVRDDAPAAPVKTASAAPQRTRAIQANNSDKVGGR